jgi:hypothetical protein
VDPTNAGSGLHDEWRATRLTRRAANAAALAVVGFWALFVFSTELPAVRAGILALTGVLTLGAAMLLALGWWQSYRYLAGEEANPAREDDALDDVLALSVDVGTTARRHFPRLGEALVNAARQADVALRSSQLGPRRHPWAFCFIGALLSGGAFSTWHSLLEGLPADPVLALWVWLLYAGILAAGIVTGYTLLGRYLRLIRDERTRSRGSSLPDGRH